MGNIGPERRRIEVLPEHTPAAPNPARPQPRPAEVPADVPPEAPAEVPLESAPVG
jgi:hypothetical protein